MDKRELFLLGQGLGARLDFAVDAAVDLGEVFGSGCVVELGLLGDGVVHV